MQVKRRIILTPNGVVVESMPKRTAVAESDRPLTPEELRACKLFIAVPTYQGSVHSGCMMSLFRLSHDLRSAGIQQMLRMLDGEMVARARNRLVADFLETDCSHLLFVDSDITFDSAALIRMLQSNLSVIGGVYPKKSIRWQGAFTHARNSNGDGSPETTAEASLDYVVNALPTRTGRMVRDCIEVKYVGTGFLLIQRRVIEAMVKRYKKLSYSDDFADAPARRIPALFDYGIVNDRYLSEDYKFCQHWIAMGGKIWASATCKLAHAGSYIFQGDFGRRLRASTTARLLKPARAASAENSRR